VRGLASEFYRHGEIVRNNDGGERARHIAFLAETDQRQFKLVRR
jgi:hypothetical protein